MVFPTGYDPAVIGSPSWSSVQGGYFDTTFRPFDIPNAGTKQMQSALEKYAHFKSSDFPTFSQYESWLGADLMIKGLELAGKNPTRAAVISDLRHLKSYNGNGLLPQTINYSTDFGKDLAEVVRLVHDRREERFRPGLDHADLRHGPSRDVDRPVLTDARPPAR